ncbi:MAG: molybdopterin-dependent oxidoreductase [Cytophagales bacterium]
MKQSKKQKSTCCYCGVGCGIEVEKMPNGKININGDVENPVNKGLLCSKGMNLHYTANNHENRLLFPQMRLGKGMPLQRVSWENAMNRAAATFKTLISKFGPDSVAFYVSGQCTTEEYYVVNKLIKGFIGSNNIDTNSRLCMSSAVVGYKKTLGEDAVPCSYEDLDHADTFLVAGANPAWCHPIMWKRVEARKRENPDSKLIVVDPRKTQTAEIADLHLQIMPGTDAILFNAIGRLLIEKESVDFAFVTKHCNGFEEYKELVFKRSLKEASKICGVKSEDILWAAEYISRAKGFMTLWTMGLNQSVIGVNKNTALINLNLITGHIGKKGSGPFSLTGQPNAMGGREVGGLANLLPNHRELGNEKHRKEVQNFWGGVEIAPKPGLTATEMVDAIHEGKLKAIWVICTNPLVSLPDAMRAEEAYKKVNFLVVQDMSDRHECIPYADLVLPAATWAEKEGTMTNSERRISYLSPVVKPPGEARPDAEIIIDLAKRLGFGKAFAYDGMKDIFAEHARFSKGTNADISGLSYEILKEKGTVQWPYPEGESGLGTVRLFEDFKFFTHDQKANICSMPDENQSYETNKDYPLILTTGRVRDQWHTMTRTGKVNKLNQHIPEPFVEINPKDAEKLGLKENDISIVSTAFGTCQLKVKLTSNIKRGVIFVPMHWGKTSNDNGTRANNLTNNLIDPISKEPDLKFTPANVTKFRKQKEKIVIVGAGAAAYAFVKEHRQHENEDEILIFNKESHPFYNRVMLPDYVSNHQRWEQLLKASPEEMQNWKIEMKYETEIVSIDREKKLVYDQFGESYSYDRLILGMGSRAFMPSHFPKLKGLMNMRTRSDADKLKDMLPNCREVVVIGGGLLGLEMAASLKVLGLEVYLLNRTNRLMERQLDVLGSQLLFEEMLEIGVNVLLNEEADTFLGLESVEGLILKSGKKIGCQAVIVAVGTQPNMEIAKSAGLKINRAIEVDERLSTSDTNIHALGELAEFKGNVWGITAAAEQQAIVLSRFLNGDSFSTYQGSVFMNLLKVEGLQIASIGQVEIPKDNPDFEEIVFIDKAKRYYKKCVVKNDVLVGCILMGDKSEFLEFRDLISKRIELSDKRLQLLRSNQKAEPVVGKLVCSCNNVGEGNLEKAIASGCKTLEALCNTTGAGTGCGSCRVEVKGILEKNLGKKNKPQMVEA